MTLKTKSAQSLPPRIKVLYITTLHRTGGWLTEAFSTDNATEILLEEAVGITSGAARLREEVFDAILISHEPGVLDALDAVEGLRGGGTEEPILVLGSLPPQEVEAFAYEVGADAYCCVQQTTTRTLLWVLTRALERTTLVRENRRLLEGERQRLQQEHQEAERLLGEQRALVTELESLQSSFESAPDSQGDSFNALSSSAAPTDECVQHAILGRGESLHSTPLPAQLVEHYQEILRAYIMMGTGNLSQELSALAEVLASAGVGGQAAIQLHVRAVENIVRGLGSRSARHVMNRADLLVLEMLAFLCEYYREAKLNRIESSQLMLPGFEDNEPQFLSVA